ncbi:hypothetical protein C1645_841342 [Glomus cerebriforme]|uniref:Uncharacterized protein n=1 Tax=Glomus cerebriforme TaxID=658196 RepID=A0A397S2Y8_9GLOM|nr:hypothetical protein C1645_841342 [Glomus cerebriforme]
MAVKIAMVSAFVAEGSLRIVSGHPIKQFLIKGSKVVGVFVIVKSGKECKGNEKLGLMSVKGVVFCIIVFCL